MMRPSFTTSIIHKLGPLIDTPGNAEVRVWRTFVSFSRHLATSAPPERLGRRGETRSPRRMWDGAKRWPESPRKVTHTPADAETEGDTKAENCRAARLMEGTEKMTLPLNEWQYVTHTQNPQFNSIHVFIVGVSACEDPWKVNFFCWNFLRSCASMRSHEWTVDCNRTLLLCINNECMMYDMYV